MSVPGSIWSSSRCATFSALICGDLELVATDIHAAPAARTLFTRIKKVDDARLALSDAMEFGLAQQIRSSFKKGDPQIRRLFRIEDRFSNDPAFALAEYRCGRVPKQTRIDLLDELIPRRVSGFDAQNGTAQSFAKSDQILEKQGGFSGLPPTAEQVLRFLRLHDSRSDEPAFESVNVREKLCWTLGKDRFGVEEIKNRAVCEEEKTIYPIAGFLICSTH